MRRVIHAAVALSILLLVSVIAIGDDSKIGKPADPVGDVDKCTVVLKETAKANHWMVEVNLTNDEPLFGMVFPLILTSSAGQISYDSTSFAGTRIESFAVKIPHEDEDFTKSGKGLKLNLGLIGSIGPVANTLDPGSGVLARHYITGSKGVTTETIMVDTTFVDPANTLRLNMLDASTTILPEFEFKRAE